MAVARVVIPYTPRPQFIPFHNRKQRWAVMVAHRRAGKTVAVVNDLIRGALTCPKPNPRFAYLAPYFAQAKDVAWSYLKEFSAPIPGVSFNEAELRADYPNGGRVRLYGADNADRLRGIYLDGVVPDEYGDMDPRVWPEVIRPALSDRGGWAAFIGTPKGRNDFAKMYERGKVDPEWYALMLKASETGLVPDEELNSARGMMTAEQYEQEYECSFDAAIIGSYYGKEFAWLDKTEPCQIGVVPYDKSSRVYVALDLGVGDPTAIWWCQQVGREIHLIDYYENRGLGVDHYCGVIESKPYQPAAVILPHDAEAKSNQTGKSYRQMLQDRGFHNCVVLSNASVENGIDAVRLVLNRCWFDKVRCEHGIECLRQYRADYVDKTQSFRTKPLHDWTSHGADAFRYLIAGLERAVPKSTDGKKIVYPKYGVA